MRTIAKQETFELVEVYYNQGAGIPPLSTCLMKHLKKGGTRLQVEKSPLTTPQVRQSKQHMPMTFTTILDFLGTLTFAISGIRLASGKQIDWFGAYIIGLVTAIGGGTLRDLLLNITPFWMLDAKYFITTGLALVVTLLFKDKIFKLGSTLFLFDTIGLGLFTIVGITKSMDAGLPIWVSIIMGTITGTLGGVVRDVLLNEVPLLFRRDIYALACVAGGGVYFVCKYLDLPTGATETIAASVVIALRLVAVKFHIHLPKLQPIGEQGSTP